MELNKKGIDRRIVIYIIITAAAILGVKNFEAIIKAAGIALNVLKPLLLGAVIAYILNIIMKKIERVYFPKSDNRLVKGSRRIVSILLSMFSIVVIFMLIVRLILPEIIDALSIIGNSVPVFLEKLETWIIKNADQFPTLEESLSNIDINWNNMIKNIVSYTTSGFGSLLNSTISIVGVVGSSVINAVVAIIFSIYILVGKEKLSGQMNKLMNTYLKDSAAMKIRGVLSVANESFSSFIVGQVTEAVILGSLCAAGMFILRLPYAPMVGALIGATALIPVAGAYIGGAVGAFLILTVSPVKVIVFLVFLVVLQQLEGNLIYPRVVGASIGLPGIWVLAAVTIGGGILGVGGMLLGVPCAATVYKLIQNDVNKKNSGTDQKAKTETSHQEKPEAEE